MKIFLKKLRKKILENTWRPILVWYLSTERSYKHKEFDLIIFPGVFHPGFFLSTTILLEFLGKIHVSGRKILELGTGSGLISLAMAARGGNVYASDISTKAVENARENALRNNLEIKVIQSDLFQNLQGDIFDLIIINPPYYPYNPSSESEHAWYCGENFEYFKSLFDQLGNHFNIDSEVYIILSEDCDFSVIEKNALRNRMKIMKVFEKKRFLEWNYIYRILSDYNID